MALSTLRLRYKSLRSHVGIYGDTGGGKGLFVKAYLREVERRGEIAVIWDPEREYARLFRSVKRGDWILDPTVEECPYWDIRREYKDEGEAFSFATYFFPDNPALKDPFWNDAARGVFANISANHNPTLADWAIWLANDQEIDRRVAGTEFARILSSTSPGLRSSVISHMNMVARPLRMMPLSSEGRRTFSVRDWSESRKGWVFVTSKPSYSEVMKPLHGLWLASIINRIIDMGHRPDLPAVHVIFEEASTIIIQAFHTALVRLRKTHTPLVFAIQNFADLKAVYGEKAETIYSQPYHKIFFRISNDVSAHKAEATIGQKRVQILQESYTVPMGIFGRRSRSLTVQRDRRPVVECERIQNLNDRKGYIIRPGFVAPFTLPIIEMKDRAPAIVERTIPPMLRTFGDPVPAVIPEAVRAITTTKY